MFKLLLRYYYRPRPLSQVPERIFLKGPNIFIGPAKFHLGIFCFIWNNGNNRVFSLHLKQNIDGLKLFLA